MANKVLLSLIWVYTVLHMFLFVGRYTLLYYLNKSLSIIFIGLSFSFCLANFLNMKISTNIDVIQYKLLMRISEYISE